MNNKTLFIIGLFICLLFTIPMVSAADANDSHLIDNSVIGTNISSQAITTSDANGIDKIISNTNDNTITNIDANNNHSNSIIDINDSNIENQKDGSNKNIIKSVNKNKNNTDKDQDENNIEIADISLGTNNKNSNDKNTLSANALGALGDGTSFADLQKLINDTNSGETLTLGKDYTFVSGTDNDYINGITITKPIKIEGAGHTIDANHMARIFYITGNDVFINDIIFKNGHTNDSSSENGCGAAVYAKDVDLDFERCSFENNHATGTHSNGGAIYFDTDSHNSTINFCNFTDNSANRNGGAIDWHNNSYYGELKNSRFENNIANRSAGAVFWKGHDGNIINCTFINNKALGITEDAGDMDGSTRKNGGDAGAVMWTGSNGTVQNSNFTNNNATFRGGAIYLQGEYGGSGHSVNTSVIGCNFTQNHAGYNGGAIDWHEGSVNGSVINSTFHSNTAERSGGAIYWNGHYGLINGSNFTENKALGILVTGNDAGDGGAVIWTGSYGTVDNSIFKDNYAKYKGGAIFIEKNEDPDPSAHEDHCYNTSVLNSHFEKNFAGTNGGAIDWSAGAMYGKVSDSTFVNNTANRTGGAIFWNGINGTIKNSNFTNNSAKGLSEDLTPYGELTTGGDGGAVMWSGSNGVVEYCNFDDNTARWRGGAILLQKVSANDLCENTTVRYSNFTNNHAGLNGGAINWALGARYGHIINSTFKRNSADRSAGAVYWNGLYGEITNSTFEFNTAIGNYTGGDHRTGVVNDTNGGNGGGVVITGSYTNLTNSNFTNNTALGLGGAVFLRAMNITDPTSYCNDTHIRDCRFENNSVNFNGGALAFNDKAYHCSIENSVFYNNSANRSGGAVLYRGNMSYIDNCDFRENTVTGSNIVNVTGYQTLGGIGGAIAMSGSDINLTSSNFTSNTANRSGGAIYWMGANGLIKDSIFYNNSNLDSNKTAPDGTSKISYAGDGGAIYWIAAEGIIENSTFKNNSAKGDGGGVVFGEGSQSAHVYNSKFYNNTADRSAGAARWIGAGGEVENCTFIDNYALGINLNDDDFDNQHLQLLGGNGGAITWLGSFGRIRYSNFTSNHAEDNGGAILVRSVNVTDPSSTCIDTHVVGCRFINNTAGYNGGALGLNDNAFNCSVTDSKFYNNTAARSGGALFWSGSDGLVDNCDFMDNNVNGSNLVQPQGFPTHGGNGGAALISGSRINITNSNFTSNTARLRGGAIFLRENNHTTILNVTFKNNTAGTNGGAINFYMGANYGNIINSTFLENYANRSGGGIYWHGDNGVINNTYFFNNWALNQGTNTNGSDVINPATGELSDPVYFNITDGGNGGGIYWEAENGTLENCTFDNNTATHNGGAIFYDGYNGTMIDVHFNYNRATGESHQYNMNIDSMDDVIVYTNKSIDDISSPTTDKLYIIHNSTSSSDVDFYSYAYNGTDFIPLDSIHYDNPHHPSPTDWGIDQFFGGDGGSILWSGDVGLVENCTFDHSNSARRGGGAYMT